MKKVDIVCVVVIIVLLGANLLVHYYPTQEKELIDIIPQVKSSVVHISCPQWQGSGFILGPHIIGTARHIVKGVENFKITLDCGAEITATRAISSKEHDIAFIWVDEPMPPSIRPGSITECQLGQEVFTIGSPLGMRHFNSISFGIVSELNRDYGKYLGWQIAWRTDATTFGGSSGCPVFTLGGKVVGILVGGPGESMSICLPVDLLPSLEKIELMFLQDEYYREEESVYVSPDYIKNGWQ
jgi:S1-C subfamily serine protease